MKIVKTFSVEMEQDEKALIMSRIKQCREINVYSSLHSEIEILLMNAYCQGLEDGKAGKADSEEI